MRRRQFLTSTGLLWAMSLSEPVIAAPLLNSANSSLTSSSRRKLALLVGINNYAAVRPLKGCLTDLELQRELLIYRYGFAPADIVTIADQMATAENIHNAIIEHLLKQVKADDLVVFHFSGYGGIFQDLPQLVLADDRYLSINNLLNYWQALATDKITTIIDTGFVNNTPTNICALIDRSYPNILAPVENPFTIPAPSTNRKTGIIINASKSNSTTIELGSDRSTYGLFTNLLTRYLWSLNSPTTLNICFQQVQQDLSNLSPQTTAEIITVKSKERQNLPYYTSPLANQGVVGVIEKVENNLLTLWLGGLAKYQGLSYQLMVDRLPDNLLTIEKPEDFTYPITVSDGSLYKTGLFLEEFTRAIPTNLGLNLGFADKFQSVNCEKIHRIERVEAISVFSSINTIEQIVNLTESEADILLAKITENNYRLIDRQAKMIGNYPIDRQLSIKSLAKDSVPELENLLAYKLYQVTENSYTSRLPIKVTLETISPIPNQIFCKTSGNYTVSSLVPIATGISEINTNSKLHWQIESEHDRPIYFCLITINQKNQILITKIPSDNSFILPEQKQDLELNTISSRGLVNHYLIISITPFTNLYGLLNNQLSSINNFDYFTHPQPVKIAQTILEDLTSNFQKTQEFYHLNVNNWLTMNITYQLV